MTFNLFSNHFSRLTCTAVMAAALWLPLLAQAAPKKKPNPIAPRNALSMTPGMWKFTVVGGMYIPREGNLDAGPVVEVEASRVLGAKNRLGLGLGMAFGDIQSAPGFERESSQKYLHLTYTHHSNVKNPMGHFYYGGGLSWGQQRAVAGGKANGAGMHLLAGYLWRSGFVLQTRYTRLDEDKNTDLGGFGMMAGYSF